MNEASRIRQEQFLVSKMESQKRQKEEARQLLERAQLAIDRGKEEESDQLLKKARKIMQAVLSALRDRYGEEEVSKHRSPASPAPSVEV